MSLKLPYQQTQIRQLNQYQQALSTALLPITSLATSQSIILENITLTTGSVNIIAHKLNRKLSGWYPVRVRSQSTIWDTQDSNTNPTQTLYLNVSADVVVDLIVF